MGLQNFTALSRIFLKLLRTITFSKKTLIPIPSNINKLVLYLKLELQCAPQNIGKCKAQNCDISDKYSKF